MIKPVICKKGCFASKNILVTVVSVLFSMVFLLGVSGCNNATKAVKGEASEVAENVYMSLSGLNWDEQLQLLHPDALKEFKYLIMLPLEPASMNLPDSALTDSVFILDQPFSYNEMDQMEESVLYTTILNFVFERIPLLKNTFLSIQSEVIGEVPEGDNIIHVVSRVNMDFGGRQVDEIDVLTIKRIDGNMKSLLSTKVKGIAQLIQQSEVRKKL